MALWAVLLLAPLLVIGQLNSDWVPAVISTQAGTSFSTGLQPLFGPSGTSYAPVVGWSCSGTSCGNKVVSGTLNAIAGSSNISMLVDTSTSSLTDAASSGVLTTTYCPLGAILARLSCAGTNCASVTLQCMRPTTTDNVWRTVNNGTYAEVASFQTPNSGMCPQSSVVCGIDCMANGCGTIQLHCCYVEIRVCRPGYAFDPTFACAGIPCAVQPNPANGIVSSTNFNSYPSVSTLQCNNGYRVQGTPTRTCDTAGVWSGVVAPSCVGITCNAIAPINHGSVSLSNGYTFPTTATFSCAAGYVVSQDTQDCFYDGTWTGDLVTCMGVQCAALQDPDNGLITVTNGYSYPASATLSCEPGFTITGQSTASCATDGSWSGTLGSCTGVLCATLPSSPRYAKSVLNGGRYPSSAFLTCSAGCVGGTQILTCLPNGTWEGTIPACPYISCGYPVDPGGNYCADPEICDYFTANTNLSYRPSPPGTANWVCSPGWTYWGVNQSVSCQANGIWSSLVTWCHAIYCNSLPAIPATSLTISNQQWYPSVGVYTCVSGYVANSTSLTCQKDRTWVGDLGFTCKGRVCDAVQFVTPSCNCQSETSNNGSYPSTTYFRCNPGYLPSTGNSYRQCTIFGNWTNTNLQCLGVGCVVLSCTPVPCAVNYTNGRRYPSTANVTCPSGYTPSVPAGLTTCAQDGNWVDRVECLGIQCNTIPSVSNGTRSWTNNLKYPSTASTSCDAGYMLSGGAQFLTCNTDGTWSGAFPQCVGVPCSTQPFTYAVQTYTTLNNFSYPDTATAVCNSGYQIAVNTFSCSTLGVYCCAPFNCTGIPCNPVANHSSYNYVYNSSLIYPVSVTYTCAPDYYTINKTFGYCTSTSNFNIPPPRCLRFAIDMLFLNGVKADFPNGTNTTRYVTTSSYFGGDTLTIVGDFGITTPVITYGPTALIQFPCTPVSSNKTALVCTTSRSYGASCRIYLKYAASEVANLTIISPLTLFITHPQPTIQTGSLILFNSPPPNFGWTWPLKALSTKGGDVVVFNGTFFSNWTCCVKVMYGPAVDDLTRECVLANVTDSIIVCTTSPGEQGPHFFQVTVYDVSSDLGKDGYVYPLGPIVNSVQGCTTVLRADNTTEATKCPTEGGVLITILGSNFVDVNTSTPTAPTYMIGSTFGVAANFTNNSIVVSLPVGIGSTAVIIASPTGQSAAKLLITYAVPSFTSLSGCSCTPAKAPCVPFDCSRTGQALTVTGANFGLKLASVFLVGVGPCTNVVHDVATPHSKLTCTLPPGFALHQPVALLQLGGFLSFADAPLDVSYLQCTPGQYQNGASTTCALCSTGQFSALSGQTVCENCAYGEFSNKTGSSKCIKAAEGSYVPNVAATQSTPCPPGQYSLTPGAYVCKDCPPGFFAPVAGTSSCTACGVGRAQASQGQLSCTACLAGFFAASPGLLQCVPCAAGSVASSSGSATCTPCGVAQYSANSSACIPCAAGKYVNVQGASSCLQCDEGYFASRPGLENCDACPVGAYQPSKEGQLCQNCSASTFSNIPGASQCFKCDAGSYADISGLGACKDCPVGTYGPIAGLEACILCPAGRFAVNIRSSKCADCPAGTSQPLTGSSFCADCDPGKYAQDAGWRSCSDCLPGSIAQNFRSAQCTPCPLGTAATVAGGTNCDQCPKGFYGPAEGQTRCLPCAVGSYSVTWRSTSCVTCSMGKYQNATGLTDCEFCEAGFFVDSQGASQCRACEAGSFTNSKGYPSCQNCQPGTATRFSMATICADCLPGSYSQYEHSIECDSCSRGRFQSYSRGSICLLCEEGTSSNQPYANQSGATICESCAPGMYAPLSGTYSCSFCEPGKYADQYHSVTCSFCLEGTATNQTGQLACTDCVAGSYAETLGSVQCQKCLSGKFTDVPRTVRCRLCQTGTATNTSGSTVCQDCFPGSFASNLGSIQCDLCPKGFYSAVPRTSVCLKCPKGTSNNITGQTECSDCAVGSYSNALGAFDCTPCQPGSYADVLRSVSCGDCPPGRFIGVQSASTCELCLRGKYNQRPGSGDCLVCQRGSIAAEQGQPGCEDCKPGQFGLKDGESSCTNCVSGRFQKREGATGCDICEAGTYAESGREICTTCGPGTAMPFKGAVKCDQCDINGKSANPPLDCVCNVGYFAPTRSTIENATSILGCTPCPKGLDCTSPGNTFETLRVLAGWWRTDQDSLDMYKCVLPTHCLGGRNSTCGQARIGLVCSLCLEGYAAGGAGRTGSCDKCKERSNSLVQAIFFCLLLFLGLGVLYYLVLRSQRQNMQRLKTHTESHVSTTDSDSSTPGKEDDRYDPAVYYDSSGESSPTPRRKRKSTLKRSVTPQNPNSRAKIGTSNVSISPNSSFTSSEITEGKKATIAEAEEERISQKKLDKKKRAGVTGKMRILVSMLQIGTTLVSSLNIPWPSLFRDFLDALNFVNLDFVPWQSVGCVAHISYFTKLYMITAIPILAFLSLVFFFMLPLWLWDRRDLSDIDAYRVRRELSRAKLWRLMLFTVFLVYPYVSSSIFRMYVCYYLDGNYYMKMDFEVKCYQEEWNSMIWPSALMIILYPFGIPFVTFVLLYRGRKTLDDPKTRVQLGFLYESYTNTVWFYELIVMINKLFLTSFVGFFPDYMQMPAALLWLFGFQSCLLLLQPYVYKSDDRLDLFAVSLLMLLCLCGHVLNTSPTLDSTTDFLLSIVLILLFIVVFITFNFMAIRLLVRKSRVALMKHLTKSRKSKKAAKPFRLGREMSVVSRPSTGLAPIVHVSMVGEIIEPLQTDD